MPKITGHFAIANQMDRLGNAAILCKIVCSTYFSIAKLNFTNLLDWHCFLGKFRLFQQLVGMAIVI